MRRGGGRAAGTGWEDAAHGPSPEAAQVMLGCGVPGRLAEEAWPSYNGKRQGDCAVELAGTSGLKPMEDGDRCDSVMREAATTGRHTHSSPGDATHPSTWVGQSLPAVRGDTGLLSSACRVEKEGWKSESTTFWSLCCWVPFHPEGRRAGPTCLEDADESAENLKAPYPTS